jgi:SNF2 family DNA or RNA helicase
MKAAYNREIDKMREKEEYLGRDLNQSDVSDNLMTIRRIIGMAKVKEAANRIAEFIEDTEDDKIAIGIHHHTVRDALVYELSQRDIKAARIDASKDIQYHVDQWKNRPESRVAVISQLGGGVGLNLQFCHNLLNIERQWNSADEEQLEDRFNRFGQEYPVSAEYLVAKGTIDIWFTNMVEEKRQISGETFGINFDPTQSQETMREMLQWMMTNKL